MKMKYFKATLRDDQGKRYFRFIVAGGTKSENKRGAEYDAKQVGRTLVDFKSITQREFDYGL